MTRSGSATGSGLIRTACAMLKIAVTAPMATARIITTVADNQPPRRTFLEADLKSLAMVMSASFYQNNLADDRTGGSSRGTSEIKASVLADMKDTKNNKTNS